MLLWRTPGHGEHDGKKKGSEGRLELVGNVHITYVRRSRFIPEDICNEIEFVILCCSLCRPLHDRSLFSCREPLATTIQSCSRRWDGGEIGNAYSTEVEDHYSVMGLN